MACQRELALEYLSHGDYIRATIYAFEGFVTTLIDDQQHERFWDFRDRDKARKEYQSGLRGEKWLLSDYFLLKGLRNALAHGTRPDDPRIAQKIEGALSDSSSLQNELKRLIKKLLPR